MEDESEKANDKSNKTVIDKFVIYLCFVIALRPMAGPFVKLLKHNLRIIQVGHVARVLPVFVKLSS